MRRPWLYPALWGAMLGVSAAILWVWTLSLPAGGGACANASCPARPYFAAGLLTAAAAGSIAYGAYLLVRRREGVDRDPRVLADQSMATVVLALGVAAVAFSGAVGRWLLWIGLGLAAFGAGGVVREARAGRRLRRPPPGSGRGGDR